MITVFFNVLFLLGKYVYKKYHGGNAKNPAEIVKEEPACRQACESERFYLDDEDSFTARTIVFKPPAYLQRYIAIRDVITSPTYAGKIHKIVDFGCSELGLFPHLKKVSTIEEMLFVDIDRELLNAYKRKIEPSDFDYTELRNRPLKVFIYEGSVTDNDKILENTDAVICIELIEHLDPETLRNVPGNIFGFIKPQIAIITTPNADFNVVFGPMTGFRHADHKFEWSRAEFEKWAHDIVNKYRDYEVTFQGICPGPEGTEQYGCCSQMAVFHHRRGLKLPRNLGVEGLFQHVRQTEYPFEIDNRSDEEKIFDNASHYIERYQINSGNDEMPLNQLAHVMDNASISLEFLQDVLENGGYAITQNQENETCVVCQLVEQFDERPGYALFEQMLNEHAFFSDYDSSDDDDPPANYPNTWAKNDVEENWDDDYETWNEELAVAITDEDPSNTEVETELSSKSIITAIDSQEFNDIVVSNDSKMSSDCNDRAPQISSYMETTSSPQQSEIINSDVQINDTYNLDDFLSTNLASGDDLENLKDQKTTFFTDDVSLSECNHPHGTSTPRRINVSSNVEVISRSVGHEQHSEAQNLQGQEPLVVAASCESSPTSRSPEMLDSGYPNTYSAPDMTPEYDLPSIAQDSASDSESSSAAKRPRLVVEPLVVENGDLANNNRDGEGNNMLPVVHDNLEPLMDVLENDIQNENDIYELENGFPVWLLRLQHMGPLDLVAAQNNDSSSSEDGAGVDENRNQDEDTDNDNVEDLDEN